MWIYFFEKKFVKYALIINLIVISFFFRHSQEREMGFVNRNE